MEPNVQNFNDPFLKLLIHSKNLQNSQTKAINKHLLIVIYY